MKSKVKVDFIEADTLDELEEKTRVSIEAIQVNIKNQIKDIKTITKVSGGYLVQITYEELCDDIKSILNEEVK